MVVLHARLGHHLDARPDAVAIALDAVQRNIEPVPCMRASVHPQFGIFAQSRYNSVDASVPVEVAKGAAAMPGGSRFGKTRFGSQGLPFAAGAQIVAYGVRLIHCVAGRRVPSYFSPGSKQIFPTIVVEVVERCSKTRHGEAERMHAAGSRHFDEIALPGIQVNGKRLSD